MKERRKKKYIPLIHLKMRIKEIFKIISVPVLGASLCCLSPLLLFVFGFGSLALATSLSDIFYGQWKWAFRVFGLLLLMIFLIIHFKKQNICSLDQAKRNKNKVINTVLIALFGGILGYIFFLYIVVHYWGVWLGVWN